jgi:hypothetical protein
MGNFPRFLDDLECDVSHGEEHYETNVSNLISVKIDDCQGRKKFLVGHQNNIALSASMWHVSAMPVSLHSLSWFLLKLTLDNVLASVCEYNEFS